MSDPLLAPAPQAIFDCSILVVCGDPAALAGYCETLRARGYSVIGEADPARAVRHLRDRRVSVVFTDVPVQDMPALAPLFAADPARIGVEFVAMENGLTTDRAVAPPHTEWLTQPFDRAQFLTAITGAFNVARLQRFRQEEMRALETSLEEFRSRTMAAISQLMTRAQSARLGDGPHDAPAQDAPHLPLIEEEARRARLRERLFGPLAFNHGSWMLLLALGEARLKEGELTVKSAAYAAGLPLSSALRKINDLCAAGLITRKGDPQDGRRSFVALAPTGLTLLARYLSELAGDRAP